jgi:hypothetical protein
MKRVLVAALLLWACRRAPRTGQVASPTSVTVAFGMPLTATPKGPSQINLSWPPNNAAGYGYLIEIQSSADSRYPAWTELVPILPVGGYACDPSVVINGGTCSLSDNNGTHVYNPPDHSVPYWVTDTTYIDPSDGTHTQFIAANLAPATAYQFRIRPWSGGTSYGPYSAVASATTANYAPRYVSTTGDDTHDGLTAATAWRHLSYSSNALACGQVLVVATGNYDNDQISMYQTCSASNRAVVLAQANAVMTSASANASHAVTVGGSYIVIDGLQVAVPQTFGGDYDIVVGGNHNAFLGIEIHPPVVPTAKGGINVAGSNHLIYGSALHDYGSPENGTQNPLGNNGFPLAIQNGSSNVIWSNHLTRGGHDVSLCIRGCNQNRWLNNVMDGGWGMGFEAIEQSNHNLVEGSIIFHPGRGITAYKPGLEISAASNVVRRCLVLGAVSNAIEISALYGGDSVANSLFYNNTLNRPGQCVFQSHNGGVVAYNGVAVANNICFGPNQGFEYYLNNTNSGVLNNAIVPLDAAGNANPSARVITWWQDGGGNYQYPQTVGYADTNYVPPFAGNAPLVVLPQFVNESAGDFHLQLTTPLAGAGVTITDPDWSTESITTDIGAYKVMGAPSRASRGKRR